ncbi:l-amino acid oxidase [Fusarium beomiforme]|uniref:L-amino acid oxidase n=1 Tax=Fusarium beomiforme TaxID=44412 RepID=A0A9P5ALW4_9HYPO|nr:l-amino acid oxidase [Fusarium beomiforme]
MRTIAREDAGYYHAVVIGAVYDFADGVNIKSPATYFNALRRCIEEHPFFCVTVGDRNTDKGFYERVASINVEEHINFVEDENAQADSLEAIGRSMKTEIDRPFVAGIPPWRIVVLPTGPSQCHVAFSYSHTIGDGIAGVAFHKTFLAGLQETPAIAPSSIIAPPNKPLPEPFDTAERLPISWSFLLAPVLAEYMPYFLVRLFGLRVSASYVDDGTWTAAPIFFNAETYHNNLKIRQVEASQVNKVIQLARTHDARLSGVMHQLITRALSRAVKDNNVTNFVAQTAINMRRSIGMSNDVASDIVSGCYTVHLRSAATGPLTEQEWASAAEATKEFAITSTKLEDNAIGLLRYVPSMRKWTLGKIGKKRDSSYEFSNVGAFDGNTANNDKAKVSKLTFAQPGHVGGCPICFNIASVTNGDLVYTVTWQPGALGLGDDAAEEKIVEEVCDDVQRGFNEIA